MRITNSHQLPETFVAAVRNDPYTKGRADFSATELLLPSRLWALRTKWSEHLTTDVVSMIPALMGKAVHNVLETAGVVMPGEHREQRLFAEYGGMTVSGQLDLRTQGPIIEDYKTCKVYKLVGGSKEWEQQLNIYNSLAVKNGHQPAVALRIHALALDWSLTKASQPGYPPVPIATLEQPIWPIDDAHRFVEERIASHLSALTELPLCTPEERWDRPTWVVLKTPDAQRAAKKESTEEAAAQWLANKRASSKTPSDWDDAVVQQRSGESVRCRFYCPVRDFCTQFRDSN